MSLVADEEGHQLAVLTSPRVRHRSASRDLEEAPQRLSPLSPPHYRALSLNDASPDSSPPLTPHSRRTLRTLAPAGAALVSALDRKVSGVCVSFSARGAAIGAVAGVAALALLLFTWGVASPAHLPCRAERAGAALGDSPFLAVSPCDGTTPRFTTPVLRANDVQVLGTHNSYHLEPRPAFSSAWRYSHPSLTAQLNAGARSVELDVHYDPVLHTWTVYHEPWVDPRSTCKCVAVCVRELWRWSQAHPGHTLLFLIVEPKFNIDITSPFRNGKTAPLRQLQDAILSGFPAHAMLTPAAVQGDAPTLRAAIAGPPTTSCGWPSAEETRGALMAVLDVWDENAAAATALRNLPLAEQLFFLRATESYADLVPEDAAVVEPEECGCAYGFDKKKCTGAFSALVRAGYLVRASVGTAACAPYETKLRSAAAAAAGVQIMVTDYLDAAALPCRDDAAACCVPNRTSAAPCILDVLPLP